MGCHSPRQQREQTRCRNTLTQLLRADPGEREGRESFGGAPKGLLLPSAWDSGSCQNPRGGARRSRPCSRKLACIHPWGQGTLVDPGRMSSQEPREKTASNLFIQTLAYRVSEV